MITGSNWKSMSLAKLVPDLDPEKAGSFANQLQGKLTDLDEVITEGRNRVSNLLRRVADMFGEIQNIATELRNVQNTIDELVGNAAQTGVYVHFIGICPTLGVHNQEEFASAVVNAFTDPVIFRTPDGRYQTQDGRVADNPIALIDPNMPRFKGETAVLGGFLLLVGAPDPRGLKDELMGLASVFPEIANAFGGILQEVAQTAVELPIDVANMFIDLANDALNMSKFNVGVPSIDSVFGGPIQPNSAQGRDRFCNWFALRVIDLIPALDPFKENSPANLLVNLEKNFADNLISMVQSAQGFEQQINILNTGVINAGRLLSDIDRQFQDLLNNLGQTGIYFHEIGADHTVNNNIEFQNATIATVNDTTDPNRPRFRGDTAVVAGFVVVVGAPDATALDEKMKKLAGVFTAIGIKGAAIGRAARDVAGTVAAVEAREELVRQDSADAVDHRGQHILDETTYATERTTYTEAELAAIAESENIDIATMDKIVEQLRQATLQDTLDAATNDKNRPSLFNASVIDNAQQKLLQRGIILTKRSLEAIASQLRNLSDSRDTAGLAAEALRARKSLRDILMQRIAEACKNV